MEQDEKQPTTAQNEQSNRIDNAQAKGLAGAGGGSIPGQKGATGHVTTAAGGLQRDETKDPGIQAVGNLNASDQPAQGTLGGRTPGQTNTNIGDMDRPREHSGIENTPNDPMTARSPEKINKHSQTDKRAREEHSQ